MITIKLTIIICVTIWETQISNQQTYKKLMTMSGQIDLHFLQYTLKSSCCIFDKGNTHLQVRKAFYDPSVHYLALQLCAIHAFLRLLYYYSMHFLKMFPLPKTSPYLTTFHLVQLHLAIASPESIPVCAVSIGRLPLFNSFHSTLMLSWPHVLRLSV